MKAKAAAVQLSPALYSRERTIRKIVRKIEELGQQGVHFATFPEAGVPYYPYFSFVQTPTRSSADASTWTTFGTNRHQGISAIRRGVAHPT